MAQAVPYFSGPPFRVLPLRPQRLQQQNPEARAGATHPVGAAEAHTCPRAMESAVCTHPNFESFSVCCTLLHRRLLSQTPHTHMYTFFTWRVLLAHPVAQEGGESPMAVMAKEREELLAGHCSAEQALEAAGRRWAAREKVCGVAAEPCRGSSNTFVWGSSMQQAPKKNNGKKVFFSSENALCIFSVAFSKKHATEHLPPRKVAEPISDQVPTEERRCGYPVKGGGRLFPRNFTLIFFCVPVLSPGSRTGPAHTSL